MAFTKALYYPWIDIKNEAWLKNALFYWDSIRTIVPESIQQPYNNRTSKEFHDNGCLVPLRVNSNMKEINSLEKDVFKYLHTDETMAVLMKKPSGKQVSIYKEKLPFRIRNFYLYSEKFSGEVKYRLKAFLDGEKNKYLVNERFAYFYMTLLSTKLAEKHHISLLTETDSYDNLSNLVKLDNKTNFSRFQRGFKFQEKEKYLNEGVLSTLLLEKINIDPETPVNKIIKFKDKYKDELGRFRVKISELSKAVNFEGSVRAIRQQIEDLLTNEVNPSIEDLKNSLSSNKIKFIGSGFLKISLFGVATSSLPILLLGMGSAPYAVFAGAGVSLIAQVMLYNKEKQKILNKNPYSYLLTLEKKFKKNK